MIFFSLTENNIDMNINFLIVLNELNKLSKLYFYRGILLHTIDTLFNLILLLYNTYECRKSECKLEAKYR